MIPLSPEWFNMSSLGFPGTNSFTSVLDTFKLLFHTVFEYAASLHGLPDLPKWIQLVYNPMLKLGFLFGTPPLDADYVKVCLLLQQQLYIKALICNNVYFYKFSWILQP